MSLTNPSCYNAPEICDNALDDDGDGLIDLNDPDCKCKGIKDTLLIPSSLIPNPSFEEYVCCPTGLAQLNCSKNWIQASVATSDYYNTCGYKDDAQRGKPPQPLPAGNGYVGFLDIRDYPGFGIYKEYIGACFNSPLLPGVDYTLTFWVGFGTRGNTWGPRKTLNMAIFGTSNCASLPFGGMNGRQCPTQYPGWFEMTRISVSGTNKWIKTVVKLRPNVKVEAIALGPACAVTDGNYYYWLDELILEESSKFDALTIDIKGNPCKDTVQLVTPASAVKRITYQWYKDGIAIIGATNLNYQIPKGQEGEYLVRAFDGKDCELSNRYNYRVDTTMMHIDSIVCEGSSVAIGNQQFNTSGVYLIPFKNEEGCDSLVELNLQVLTPKFGFLDTSICEGQSLDILGQSITQSGMYRMNLVSTEGCDSIYEIKLSVIKNVIQQLDTSICEGQQLIIGSQVFDQPGRFSIYNKSFKGCDSILNIHLIVNQAVQQDMNIGICQSDSLWIQGNAYFKDGNYQITLAKSDGCDSIINLSLYHYPDYFTYIDTSLCIGSTFNIGNETFNTSGSYVVNLTTINGCDSVYFLNIKFYNASTTIIDTSICEGEMFQVEKQTFSQTGKYQVLLTNQHRCDSLVLLNLTVLPKTTNQLIQQICEGDAYFFNGNSYTSSGTYIANLLNKNGCDSLVQLDLTVNKTSNTALDTVLCPGGILMVNGNQFNQSGNYQLQLKNKYNCDSTVQIKLDFFKSLQVQDSIQGILCEGDSTGKINLVIKGGTAPYRYHWNTGSINSELNQLKSGQYSVTITDAHSCVITKQFSLASPECFCFNILTEDGICSRGTPNMIQINKLSGGKDPLNFFLNGVSTPLELSKSTALSSGKYLLEIFDANHCKYSKEFNLNNVNDGEIIYPSDTIYATVGDSILLHFDQLSIDTSSQFQWTPVSDNSCNICPSTKIVAQSGTTEYIAQLVTKEGCIYQYAVVVIAKQHFNVPNVFSPNGDQINDYFNLISDSSVRVIDVLQIYDRWGGRIFESTHGEPNSQNGAWNGYSKNQPVNPGVYVYLIKFKDLSGKAFVLSGDVTVMR